MAKNLRYASGSLFAGNPIVVEVTPSETLKDAVCLRVKLNVTVKLVVNQMAQPEKVFSFSAPAEAGVPLQVDISSALRAVADTYEYQSDVYEMPYLVYGVTGWEEYFLKGELHQGDPFGGEVQNGRALIGGFSDVERFMSDEVTPVGATQTKKVQRLSRKPDYGEVVSADDLLIQPVPFPFAKGIGADSIAYGQLSKALDLSQKKGIVQLLYSDLYNPATDYDKKPVTPDYTVRTLYVDEPSPDRYHFLFVNSLGALESISAQCLPEETQSFTQSSQLVSRLETFREFSRRKHRVTHVVKTLKMSTGWLTEEWMDWWLNEFFMASTVWMKVNGKYVPCTVRPEDETKVIKRYATDALSLSFSVQLDLKGSWKVIC